jgi:6-phosphogluconolactonase
VTQIKNNRPTRREFLEFGAAGALGLSLAGFRFTVANELLLYVGTYTNGKSEGIYRYRFNPASGELKPAGTTRQVVNPSYLTVSPNGRYLYAVNEVDEFAGKRSGALTAFAVEQTGELRMLNQQPSLGGSPCYVEIDGRGNFVLAANYVGGNVSVLPIQPDGSLGAATDLKKYGGSSVNRDRQEGPHAHCIVLDSSNRFAYSCDLGTDRIMIFRFDNRKGKLQPGEQPWFKAKPGAGPRHLTFHPTGQYVFVMNELDSTITAFGRNQANGSLTALRTLTTLPADFSGANTGADIHVSADGRFVYCSNRGHNSIAIFAIGRAGDITAVGHESTRGQTPRNFAIDPSGAYLLAANQKSDNVVVFRRDQRTGRLTATGHVVEVPTPVCLKFAKMI